MVCRTYLLATQGGALLCCLVCAKAQGNAMAGNMRTAAPRSVCTFWHGVRAAQTVNVVCYSCMRVSVSILQLGREKLNHFHLDTRIYSLSSERTFTSPGPWPLNNVCVCVCVCVCDVYQKFDEYLRWSPSSPVSVTSFELASGVASRQLTRKFLTQQQNQGATARGERQQPLAPRAPTTGRDVA